MSKPGEKSFDERLKDVIKEEMRKWVSSVPNPDAIFVGIGGRTLTARELLDEVERETDFGLLFIKRWLGDAIQHIQSASVTDKSASSAES